MSESILSRRRLLTTAAGVVAVVVDRKVNALMQSDIDTTNRNYQQIYQEELVSTEIDPLGFPVRRFENVVGQFPRQPGDDQRVGRDKLVQKGLLFVAAIALFSTGVSVGMDSNPENKDTDTVTIGPLPPNIRRIR